MYGPTGGGVYGPTGGVYGPTGGGVYGPTGGGVYGPTGGGVYGPTGGGVHGPTGGGVYGPTGGGVYGPTGGGVYDPTGGGVYGPTGGGPAVLSPHLNLAYVRRWYVMTTIITHGTQRKLMIAEYFFVSIGMLTCSETVQLIFTGKCFIICRFVKHISYTVN